MTPLDPAPEPYGRPTPYPCPPPGFVALTDAERERIIAAFRERQRAARKAWPKRRRVGTGRASQ